MHFPCQQTSPHILKPSSQFHHPALPWAINILGSTCHARKTPVTTARDPDFCCQPCGQVPHPWLTHHWARWLQAQSILSGSRDSWNADMELKPGNNMVKISRPVTMMYRAPLPSFIWAVAGGWRWWGGHHQTRASLPVQLWGQMTMNPWTIPG